MSYYEDERQRYRPTRERSRRDDYDDDYSDYVSRSNVKSTSLVKRRDSYEDVDEEITREFSPPGARGGYVRETTIRKSGTRPARARSYDDDRYFEDRYDEKSHAGGRRRDLYDDDDRRDRYRDRDRDRDRRRRHSSDYSSRSRSRSRTPPKRERRKSRTEEALESLGLAGLVGGILGKESKDRSSSRDRKRDRSRARSEGRQGRSSGPSKEQITQALKAAVLAGAGEAFRSRKEAGGWGGEKGKRVLTAAFSAGGVDGLINLGKDAERHKTRDTIGSAIAGLATSRIVNGPRSKSRGRGSSSDSDRGRSSSRGGGLRNLAAGGVVATAAKKIYDSARSRSRGRSRSRSQSDYSDVSRNQSAKGGRRRSVSRAAARGLAALGLTGAASKLDPDTNPESRGLDRRSRSRRGSPDRDDRPRYDDEDDYRDVGQSRSLSTNDRARGASRSRSDRQLDRSQSRGNYTLDFGPRRTGDPDTDSDSDLGSSSGEEKERKRGKRKLLITTGLASVATIHAGHSVYQSYEKRDARKRAVREGKISPEQAKESKNRDRLQDAASVGIAALGLKGAYSEWKEMKEHREEYEKEIHKHQRHHAKREARRKKFDQLQRQGYSDSGYASSMPNLHSPPPPGVSGYGSQYPDQHFYHNNGSYGGGGANQMHYYDDNPYSGSYAQPPPEHMNNAPLPPPPVGGQHYNAPP